LLEAASVLSAILEIAEANKYGKNSL